MPEINCVCAATGSGRDDPGTDMYVAQFTLPDGSVVYVGGEYDQWGRIDCAVEGGGSATFTIVGDAGSGAAQRYLTGTYQFGYFSTYASGDELAAYDGTGCGLKVKDEDTVEGVRLSIPADARERLQAVVPAATAAKLGLHVTTGAPYRVHIPPTSMHQQQYRKCQLGREKTVARLEAYIRMDKAVAAGDQEAFDAAQRELIEDMAVVCHERFKIDAQIRRGMDDIRREMAASGQFPGFSGPVTASAPAASEIPDEAQPWNFDSWFDDATARRASQDLFDQLKTIDETAKPEAFQLKKYGDCIGWDYAKLVKRLGGYHLFMKAKCPTLTITGPEATSLIAQMWNKLPPHAQKPWNDKACQDEADSAPPPAKSQKADADASPSPPPSAAPKWSQAEVNAMTVPKLKAALTELGCETSGLKAVLKARLVEKLGL